jgi:hypothetical protein
MRFSSSGFDDDDNPYHDSSGVSPLRVAGQGSELVAQSLPGLAAAAADLGDELVVPFFDQARVLVVDIEHGKDLLDQCFVCWVEHAWSPEATAGPAALQSRCCRLRRARARASSFLVGFGERVEVFLGGAHRDGSTQQVNSRSPSRVWQRAVKASGVDFAVRKHDLRHAHAS